MRAVLLLAAFLGLIWLLVPMGFNKESDPDHQQAMSASAEADLRESRQAMLNAANRLEESPCDQSLRPQLRAAIAAFIRARPAYAPMSPEEHEVITQAALAHIVGVEDLMGPFRAFAVRLAQRSQNNAAADFDTSVFAGKFACHNGDDPR